MKRKEAIYKGLQFAPVYFEDTSLTSPDYFQISEFPMRLTAGKNLFKLRGNPFNLKVGGALGIEILDYNGDPIYHEVVNYIDEDKSRVIAIYIYEDTSPGDCTITLLAEAEFINGQNVPSEWQGKPNVRWSRTVAVNPNVSNVSEIIFETVPDVTVQEIVGVQLNRIYSGSTQFPVYTTGQVRYYSYNNQPAIEIINGAFTPDMANGTITVSTPINPAPTPNYNITTTAYISSIKKILSPTTALLDKEYTVYSSQSISAHTYTSFTYSSFSLEYEATPTYVPTENSQSFAYLQVKGLDPATGDVSRIKVFTNNNGTIGSWDLVNDVELEETEIFVANTASLYPDESIGLFASQSIIDTYWSSSAYIQGTQTIAPALVWMTASLNNAMKISSSIDLSANNSILIAKTKNTGYFIEKSSYKVTIDALATRISADPVLSIYLSGSAFYADPTDYFNQDFSLGKRIGELRAVGDNQRFDDIILNFESNYTGQGVLLLVVESGEWQVSDIRTTTDNDAGYSPNYTRIKTPIQTTHKINNQISFKVEYYNVNGEKSRQISYVYNKDWEGGNRYIDGDYSMLTGSLYVADSLNSGVAISGYPNSGFIRSLGYEGFAAGFPGFLLWSGSALPGSAGTKGGAAYSGVGLELYANTASYFRYSTADSEIDVRTNKFFFGNPSSSFISGSDGKIEISASGFHLTAQGNVTASAFIAVQNGVVLFDSNNEFVDGLNIGRIVYFDRDEYVYNGPGDLTNNPQTASIFETYILPGETRMQVSYMYEFTPAVSSTGTLQAEWFIQSASYTGSVGTTTGYNSWSTPKTISSNMQITPINSVATEGGARNSTITNGAGATTFEDYQGYYVRIYMIVNRTSAGNAGDVLKLKSFVYRTSRVTGGSIAPPLNPIRS